MNKKYSELAELFRSEKTDEEILDFLLNYHKNDIADMMAGMTEEERKRLYHLLGAQKVAEIFKYIEEPRKYIRELSVESAARVISEMDSDDAVDLLEDLDPEEKEQIVRMLDEDAKKDVKMLLSYDEEEIGSCMTTNYICIPENLTIRQAMSELVKQAGENDNIMTIYVVDEKGVFAGAIDLKDLIRARENAHLEDLVLKSYPYVTDHEKIDDCMDRILDYAEDSIPVLSEDKKILGVITSEDLIEMVDNEMGEDYAKLAGLTAEEDLKEPTLQSMKKRLPWLIILLFLGMGVSTVVGAFEGVVAVGGQLLQTPGAVQLPEIGEKHAVEGIVLHHGINGHILKIQLISHMDLMVKGIIPDHVPGQAGTGGQAVGIRLLSRLPGILKGRPVGHFQHIRHMTGRRSVQHQSGDPVLHNVHNLGHQTARI